MNSLDPLPLDPLPLDPFARVEGGLALAQAIVDTIREPLLVLDKELRVVAASRSFYKTFGQTEADVQGRFLYALDDGQWDIPELRVLLEKILPEQSGMEAYEVERAVAGAGRRTMLLNARTVFYEDTAHKMILLAMEDITVWRAAETAMRDLLREKEALLKEMQHRVANSLQIIASILLLKARAVQSEETRQHLQDAHQRVMSVAAVQELLKGSRHGDLIEIGPYLTRLCGQLANSMISNRRKIAVKVTADDGRFVSADSVCLGLIVTELVINAVKHAFIPETQDGRISVDFANTGTGWTLRVADNGYGIIPGPDGGAKAGLGTSVVEALTSRLGARLQTTTGPTGTRITIRRGLEGRLPPTSA